MDLIVNDASVLIDLFKAGLLQSYSHLNYRLLLPDVVENELLTLDNMNIRELGFEVVELGPPEIKKVKELRDSHQYLSVADTFALVVAETFTGSILLTGDGGLRRVAQARGIRVHGVLWLLDELYTAKLLDAAAIVDALNVFDEDITVRLPRKVLDTYLQRYQGLISSS